MALWQAAKQTVKGENPYSLNSAQFIRKTSGAQELGHHCFQAQYNPACCVDETADEKCTCISIDNLSVRSYTCSRYSLAP